MFVSDFLAQCEADFARHRIAKARRKDIIRRVLKFFGYMAVSSVFCLGFAIFAWSAANVPAPIMDANFPFPSWVWVGAMATVAFSCFGLSGFYIFAALDELLPSGDTRRMTGRK